MRPSRFPHQQACQRGKPNLPMTTWGNDPPPVFSLPSFRVTDIQRRHGRSFAESIPSLPCADEAQATEAWIPD